MSEDESVWQGQPRKIVVGIALDLETLEAIASLRDPEDAGHAWVLRTDEALRVAAMLKDAARAAQNANRVAGRMKERGDAAQQILDALEAMLASAAGRERDAYRRGPTAER